MSDRDRVAAVLGKHEHWQRPNRTWECACGFTTFFKVDLDQHVADALIAAGATMPAPTIGCQAGPIGHEGECW